MNHLVGFYNRSFYQFNETTQVWDIIPTVWPNVADVYTDGVFVNNSLYVVNPLTSAAKGGRGARATATVALGVVTAVAVNTPGQNYNANSKVLIVGGGGTGATATITLGPLGVVAGVVVTNGGTGYTSVPTVVFIGGDSDGIGKINLGAVGTGATATANLNAGRVQSITVTAGGLGYTFANPPAITLSGGGGEGATASAVVVDGVIVAINVLTQGQGYTTAPTVTIEGIFSVVHGTVGTPKGTMIESWVERLFVAGDPEAPTAWIASKPGSAAAPLNIENFDTTDGAITDLLGKEGVITAMRVLNNEMEMYKRDSVYFNTREVFAGGTTQFTLLSRTGGAANQKSTVIIENDVWFYNAATNSIRSLGTERNMGTDPRTKALTEIIKRTMDLLDPIQDNPVMIYNKRVVKLSLKTRGAPTNNLRIIFDYNTGGFSIDLGQGVNVNTVYNGEVFYGEDRSGQAFKDESGYTANGATWPFRAATPFMDDGRPDTYKRARYIHYRGKLSYDQDLTLRLYRDGSYNAYSDYYIPSPRAQGIPIGAIADDAPWGSSEYGAALWGGSDISNPDINLYQIDELIGVQQRSNMFAIGLITIIDGGKTVTEQMILKVVDENENYKRTDI